MEKDERLLVMEKEQWSFVSGRRNADWGAASGAWGDA